VIAPVFPKVGGAGMLAIKRFVEKIKTKDKKRWMFFIIGCYIK